MITKLTLVAALVVGLIAAGPVAVASAQSNNPGNKVTICHATGSQTNPYVRISPNANGVIHGHVGHQDGRDIIPPFSYEQRGVTQNFPGQNWDAAGQAIFNNDCKPDAGVTPPVSPSQVLGGAQVEAPKGAVGAGVGGTGSSTALLVSGLLSSLTALGYGILRLRNIEQ